jgi:hypothetical protein
MNFKTPYLFKNVLNCPRLPFLSPNPSFLDWLLLLLCLLCFCLCFHFWPGPWSTVQIHDFRKFLFLNHNSMTFEVFDQLSNFHDWSICDKQVDFKKLVWHGRTFGSCGLRWKKSRSRLLIPLVLPSHFCWICFFNFVLLLAGLLEQQIR